MQENADEDKANFGRVNKYSEYNTIQNINVYFVINTQLIVLICIILIDP